MQSFLLVCLGSVLLLIGLCSSRITDSLDNVIVVKSDTLPDLINSPSLSLVFFFNLEKSRVRNFFQAYDESAEYLKNYDIKLAAYDCMDGKETETRCSNDDVGMTVYTYRNGIALISLKIANLFDVDSIMSNALHLILLHEVPIIQSRLERQELELSEVGKRDLLFIYIEAVGTEEHRIFLEIAHAYQDRLSFALTSDISSALGLQDSEEITKYSSYGLWISFCSEINKDELLKDGSCPHTMYRGKPKLFNVARFVQKLQEKSLFNAPKDGVASLFEMTSDDPIVYVYIKERDVNTEIMNTLNYDLRGSAKTVFVNMEDSDCQAAVKQQGYLGEYPSIGLKTINGTMLFLDPKDWTLSGVNNFLLPHLFPSWSTEEMPSSILASSENDENSLASLIDEVETQDDQVASAVHSLRMKEMAGLELVPGLLKDTFYRTVRRSPLLIVLFYGPFHHMSMAFLRDFGMAAQILANNFSTPNVLACVNCFDATDLCSAENVTTYPTIRIYRKNPANHETYTGSLDALAVAKAAKLLELNSPLLLTREEEVDKFIQGHHPTDFSKFSPSSVLLLTTDSTSGHSTQFKAVSKSMSQVTALAAVHPSIVPLITQKYKTTVPSIVAFNREDKVKPMRTLALKQGDKTDVDLTAFIRAATIPFVPELVPDNFPHLFARHQPMAILFVDSKDVETKDAALASFSSLATSDLFPATIFCWMDAHVKSLGLKILSEYTWTAQIPMVSVVKHRQGQVFNFQPNLQRPLSKDPIQSEAMADWLQQVLSGTATPSKILEQEKWGPPGPYFNFLKLQEDKVDRDTHLYIPSFNEGIEPPEEGVREKELEVRKMLLELYNKHKSMKEPDEQDTSGAEIVQDYPTDHGHTEL
ncbi:hypothetical protein RRG08_022272 [Elysia crispata]|uniref:Thioredoxin domain-containing protein n=1 Tax=Elysia crispata TaxID=231223 RepID=A0AAE0ZS28_9GAST|nr:hypothetical protein RRG08_022272 [Elysia crispata]